MNTQDTLLAKERDIQDIDTLLCSAQVAIGLKQTFCADETRPKRLAWFRKKLANNLLWVIRDRSGLAGVLILGQDPYGVIESIAYIVVAERMRGQRIIGPKLVQKAQTLANAGLLKAEARNPNARRLLEKCGFRLERQGSSGHPILVWSQS